MALVNMIRTLDLTTRRAKEVEEAPKLVIEEALARLRAVIEWGIDEQPLLRNRVSTPP
jgi:mRNA-degrading endonuclease toxin of MazEF toxin-antitoxin module